MCDLQRYNKERASAGKGEPLRDVRLWMGQDVWCSISIPSAQVAAHLSSCLQT